MPGDEADYLIDKHLETHLLGEDDAAFNYEDLDVVCKFCGKKDLYWMQVQSRNGTRYQLIDDATGQHHQCNPVSDDEFEDYT